MSISKFSASLSSRCEHGLAGRGKHKTVTEMDKSQMSTYSSKLKGLLNKQLDKDKLIEIYWFTIGFSDPFFKLTLF